MGSKKILIMHIGNVSGHYCASVAIEKALQEVDAQVRTYRVDTLNYANSYLTKFIYRLYIFIVKATPWFWEYLYDNKNILEKVRNIRLLIHRLNNKKIKKLFDGFRPDAVVCTQAFPCGLICDYKRKHNLTLPLVGVLTDYATHAYWLNDFVDAYVVPAPEMQRGLIKRGISVQRLKVLGIPIDAKFRKQNSRIESFRRLRLNPEVPVILIMGGGQGLGPIKKIVGTLDAIRRPMQMIVVCGTNKRLHRWLIKHKALFDKEVAVFGYARNIDRLMEISALIVTKPGGLTCAEAQSKALPIIIFNPLPGQENHNTQFLLQTKAAMKVENLDGLFLLVEELLSDPKRLGELHKKAGSLARPDAALDIARLTLSLVQTK